MEFEVHYYVHSVYIPIVLVFLCIFPIKIGIKTSMEWNVIVGGAAQHWAKVLGSTWLLTLTLINQVVVHVYGI